MEAMSRGILGNKQKNRRTPKGDAALVGSARFELTNAGVKVPCLTTWRRPIIKEKAVQERACTVFGGVPREIRTLGLQSHNLAR